MKTRAAVLREMGAPAPYAKSKPLEIVELELDPPGADEVLVKIKAAGLCHSDLSVINGSRPRVMPMALGHEASGVVEAVGEGVSELAAGDHVVLAFLPSCGECVPCSQGRGQLCEPGAAANTAGTLLGGDIRLHDQAGTPVYHHLGVSAFSDRVVVSKHSVVKVPSELPFDVAAIFGCAILTGVGAALNSAQVAEGERVAVFGLGGVGMAALLGAKVAGAAQIIAVDVMPEKLKRAKELGATEAVLAGPDCVQQIRQLSSGGVDKAIETAGIAAVLADAYASTAPGGTTVTVGLPDPKAMLEIPAVSLVAEEKTIKGCYLGSCVPARDLPKFIELHAQGLLDVGSLLSDHITLDQLNEGFDRLAEGHALRQVVMM